MRSSTSPRPRARARHLRPSPGCATAPGRGRLSGPDPAAQRPPRPRRGELSTDRPQRASLRQGPAPSWATLSPCFSERETQLSLGLGRPGLGPTVRVGGRGQSRPSARPPGRSAVTRQPLDTAHWHLVLPPRARGTPRLPKGIMPTSPNGCVTAEPSDALGARHPAQFTLLSLWGQTGRWHTAITVDRRACPEPPPPHPHTCLGGRGPQRAHLRVKRSSVQFLETDTGKVSTSPWCAVRGR